MRGVKPSALVLMPLLLAVAVLATAVASAPSSVRAAGGAIQVLAMRQQVNFPDGVYLALTAESDADIVEVKVFFRAAGSRQWGYAYADFKPGSSVTATRSIPVSEATYLAPGVDVEYYYQIRDAHGAVLKTERATVEYLDGRFDWRRVNIGPLELVYHDIRSDLIAASSRALKQDLRRVIDLLDHEPRDGFKGVIYNSYADANAAFPVQSQTTTDHGTFAGYAFPGQGVFVGQGLDRRIIVHESTHLLFREALGEKALDAPAWLDEGFATYSEPNVRIRSSKDLLGRTLPLQGMNRVSGTPKTIPLFYQKSVSVVAYLIEEHGVDNFRRMLAELKAGRVIEQALLSVYGFDVDGLDRRWAGLPVQPAATPVPATSPVARSLPEPGPTTSASDAPVTSSTSAIESGQESPVSLLATPVPARRDPLAGFSTTSPPQRPPVVPPQQQRREGPSPFVFIDVWVLAGVALLAVGAVGIRFVYTRLRRNRRDDDDAAADWDDWRC